ncbi:MAG: hypothetical protein ACYTG5_01670 [Planctomycetota bacterium]|jgi:hypothetical protein
MILRILAILSSLPLVSHGQVGAQDPVSTSARVICESCKSQGHVDCGRHRKFLDQEQAVSICSEAAACKRCLGSLLLDCKICRNSADEQAVAARRQAIAAWLGERRELLDPLTRSKGEDLMHARFAHGELCLSLLPMKVGKRSFNQHQLLHLYVERIEAIRSLFLSEFELSDSDFVLEGKDSSPRLRVYLLADKGDHRAITPKVTGIGSQGTGVKLMGGHLVYSLHFDRRVLTSDIALHRNLAHNLGHMLLSNIKPAVWLGNRGHGWVDEGVGYFMEYRIDKRCTNTCFEEVGTNIGETYKAGRWRIAVRRLVDESKLRSFAEVYPLNSDQLDWQARAQSFAYVEFLRAKYGGKKFIAFARRLMAGEATRDAIKSFPGLSILSFDDQFSDWVRQEYPKR